MVASLDKANELLDQRELQIEAIAAGEEIPGFRR